MVDFGTSFNFYQFLTPSNITSKMGGGFRSAQTKNIL